MECGVPADEFLAEMLGSQSIASKAKRRRRDGGTSPSLEVSRLGDEEEGVDGLGMNGHAGASGKNVDDLLPVGVSAPTPETANKASTKENQAYSYRSACPLLHHLVRRSRRLPGKNGHMSWM